MKALLLILALTFGGPQEGPTGPTQVTEKPAEKSAETRDLERWKAKTPEEQALLRERFEALRALSPEEREALHARARELEAQRRELQSGLAPELQERLGGLPPWERDRILREQQLTDSKSRGHSLRRSLAPEHREWVEGLVESGQPGHFEDVRHKIRGHFGDEVIGRMRKGGHLDPEQLARLEGLEGKERTVEFLRIERERIIARAAELGLPEGVTEPKWTKLLAEESPERFMKRARKMGLALFEGPPPGPDHRHSECSDFGLAEDAPSWAPDFLEAMRPTLRDRLEVRELDHHERKAAMDARVAERMRSYLSGKEWFDAERLTELEGLDDRDVMRSLEEFLEESVFSAGGRRSWRERSKWGGGEGHGDWDGEGRKDWRGEGRGGWRGGGPGSGSEGRSWSGEGERREGEAGPGRPPKLPKGQPSGPPKGGPRLRS